MTDVCDHPTEEISAVDGNGCVHIGDSVYLWGECSCGAPTIIETEIVDIERDGVGSVQHLQSVAESGVNEDGD